MLKLISCSFLSRYWRQVRSTYKNLSCIETDESELINCLQCILFPGYSISVWLFGTSLSGCGASASEQTIVQATGAVRFHGAALAGDVTLCLVGSNASKLWEFSSGGSRKKYLGPSPSSFGRQQRLSEIYYVEPINSTSSRTTVSKNLGAWARFGGEGLCPLPKRRTATGIQGFNSWLPLTHLV